MFGVSPILQCLVSAHDIQNDWITTHFAMVGEWSGHSKCLDYRQFCNGWCVFRTVKMFGPSSIVQWVVSVQDNQNDRVLINFAMVSECSGHSKCLDHHTCYNGIANVAMVGWCSGQSRCLDYHTF